MKMYSVFFSDEDCQVSPEENQVIQEQNKKLKEAANVEARADIMVDFLLSNRLSYVDFIEKATEKIIEEAKDQNSHNALGWGYFILAWLKLDFDQYDDSFVFFKKAQAEFIKSGNEGGQARVLNGKGTAYRYCGYFDKALEKYLLGLELAEAAGNDGFAVTLSLNIGTLLIDLKQYDEAIDYFQKIKLAEQTSSISKVITTLNMCKAYRSMGDLDKAEKHLQEALHLCEKFEKKHPIIYCYLEMGLLRQYQNNVDEAKEFFKKTIKLATEQKMLKVKASALLQLGIMKKIEGYPHKALEILQKAYDIFQKIGSRNDTARALRAISKSYDMIGDSENAYKKLKEYKDLESDVFNEETVNRIGVLKVQQARREDIIYKDLYNRINTISQIGQAITSTFNIKEIGNIVYKHIKNLMKADNLAVGLFSESQKEIIYRIFVKDGEYMYDLVLPIEKNNQLEGKCIESKEGFIINDLTGRSDYYEGRAKWGTAFADKNIKSIVCSPLSLRGNMVGLIIVESTEKNAYLPYHADILRALAAYTAIALENEKLFSHVNTLATTDPLTGLINRRSIFAKAAGEFARYKRYKEPLAIVMIDIDKYKSINDTYGHPAGDAVLVKVAEAFLAAIRTTDALGRIGGDEFLLLLPNTDLEGAMAMAKRVHNSVLNKVYLIEGQEICLKSSMGVAEPNLTDASIDDAIKRADYALYEAKEAGGNTIKKAK